MAAPTWRRLAIQLHLRYLTVPGAADQMEAIVEDVTERRSLEHQLLPAQKFETIGQLAGGVAHDFSNVVGAILGWAELGYGEGRAFPKFAERFARIRAPADRHGDEVARPVSRIAGVVHKRLFGGDGGDRLPIGELLLRSKAVPPYIARACGPQDSRSASKPRSEAGNAAASAG